MTEHTPRLLALVLAALALAACSASSVGEVQDEGSAGTASPITLPGAPTESAPTVTGATVEAPQPTADTGSLYLVRFGQLEAVPRVIDGAPRPRVALQELLAGPTAAERTLVPLTRGSCRPATHAAVEPGPAISLIRRR